MATIAIVSGIGVYTIANTYVKMRDSFETIRVIGSGTWSIGSSIVTGTSGIIYYIYKKINYEENCIKEESSEIT